MTEANDSPLTPEDLAALREARLLLETPGLAARLSDLLGRPVESIIQALPAGWSRRIGGITRASLSKCLETAIWSLDTGASRQPAWTRGSLFHRLAATATGAAGGAFGLPALAVELPLSTALMLRGIADSARSQGEDLGAMEPRLACLTVFALGGSSPKDEAAEAGYWAVRGLLAKSVSDAATHLARKGLAVQGAPPLVRLLATVASRFQVRVTQQVAAKAVPVVGAVSGGAINYLFTEHFLQMARGHFTVRRLERIYGEEAVRKSYGK